MKTKWYVFAFLMVVNLSYGQGLHFENTKITVEKVMAGIMGIGVYFIPTFIARDRISFKKIFILNLVTGWTIIGWMAALVWALQARKKDDQNDDFDEDYDDDQDIH